jgi:cysteine synthase
MVTINTGGYESLIGNTPLLYLPKISSLLPNKVKIFVKMESMNPGGTGKDRAALSLILDAERRGELPPPSKVRRFEYSTARRYGTERVDIVGRDDGCDVNGHVRDRCDNQHTKEQLSDQQPFDEDNYINQAVASSSTLFSHDSIPSNIHDAIVTALNNTLTHGILIEGTSGSTGISLASLSCTRGHGIIVVMPDDQSSQKADFLRRLGAGVVVVRNCSISNPGHYVNVAKRLCEWLQVERRYDHYYWNNIVGRSNQKENDDCGSNKTESSIIDRTTASIDSEERIIMTSHQQPPKLIQAAYLNQFENLANVQSHYRTTGPEIYSQLKGKVDAFVMSAGTGGTLVGVGGYLKERWFQNHHQHDDQAIQQYPPHCKDQTRKKSRPPRVFLVDLPGSSLYNKIKFGVAYASQQSEQRLRRHRYDTLAEGIGLDRVTANFGLGCETIAWDNDCWEGRRKKINARSFGNHIDLLMNATTGPKSSNTSRLSDMSPVTTSSRIIDDALAVTDQEAVHMAHYLLRHEGLFVGSSTAMNVAGALMVASQMPEGSNVVTIVCDGGQRHTSRFWNRDFIVGEWGLKWPGDGDGVDDGTNNILALLGIVISDESTPQR